MKNNGMLGNTNKKGKLYPRTITRNKITSQHLKGKILDIGCSNRTTQFENLNLKNYEGIDIDKKAIKQLKKKGINAKTGNIYNLKKTIKNKKYDTIILLGVLSHLENTGLALRETKKALKKNGRIILNIQNAYDIQRIIHKFNYKKKDYHYQIFDKQHTENLLKDIGLEIEKTYYIPNLTISKIATWINKRYCDDILLIIKKREGK